MDYIFQHPDFCLGNFINLTPAIQWLHRQRGERIPVYFSTDYVRECFIDCRFIQILKEKPEHEPLFGSNLVNPNDDKPDYQFVFEFVSGKKWTADWHTYVDMPTWQSYIKDIIVIINGSGNENPAYVAAKNPEKAEFIKQVEQAKKTFGELKVMATGSENDAKRNQWLSEIADSYLFGNIRAALLIIGYSNMVIANDTGLAHAAGAMNKNLIVLIKDGPRERIKNPGRNTTYIYL